MTDQTTTTSGTGSRLTYRGAARRLQILEVASERFLEDGYAGVSVDQIVAQVGGSKTNVYKQFGGKEGLFLAVVQSLSNAFIHDLENIDLRDQAPEQGLRTLANALLSILLQDRHLAFQRLIIAESNRFPEMGRVWIESGPEQSRKVVARYLEQQQEQGRLQVPNPLRAALFFHDMITFNPVHLAMLGIGYDTAALEVFISDAIATFLRGHSPRND
ncbi:MAG: TetR/AcrR family transcriptional regulator [Paenalcaligenes sp.]